METIIGIEIFPIISFIIFFSFFVGLLIYVMRMKKENVDSLSALPFEDSESVSNLKNISHDN
jgi:hypothetical protein